MSGGARRRSLSSLPQSQSPGDQLTVPFIHVDKLLVMKLSLSQQKAIAHDTDDCWSPSQCYVLQPPPHLGQIVSVDGPFVVVDVSKEESNDPVLKVFMSKDVQMAQPLSSSSASSSSSSSSDLRNSSDCNDDVAMLLLLLLSPLLLLFSFSLLLSEEKEVESSLLVVATLVPTIGGQW